MSRTARAAMLTVMKKAAFACRAQIGGKMIKKLLLIGALLVSGSSVKAEDIPQTEDTACPYPALLSNKDMQTYIKLVTQEILNSLAAGKQFSDQPRTVTVKEILGPLYIFIADHGWPKDITGAVSKLMSGPEEDIVACFPRLELVRRNLQENFDHKRPQEGTQQSQNPEQNPIQRQEQRPVLNAADCRAAMQMKGPGSDGMNAIFEKNILPRVLSRDIQHLGEEVAQSLENEPVTAEDIAHPALSRQRLMAKFGGIMAHRLIELGDSPTASWNPSNPACFPALGPVLDKFELRAQTAAVTERTEKQERADRAEKQEQQRQEALAEQGYTQMSVENFLLDGKETI
jgi:hypothetical protein